MQRTIAAALAVWAGCGDNLAPTVRLGDLQGERRSAECARLVRCGLFADPVTCEAYSRPPPFESVIMAIDERIVSYDGAAARQCFDALAAAPCDETQRGARLQPEACTRIFEGTLGVGDECALDVECASGSCDAPACEPSTCCFGRCEPNVVEVGLGAACDAQRRCAADSYCDVSGICAALAGVGSECRADGECDYGLACIGATDLDTGRCRALALIGGDCPYLRCAELGAVCTSASTCVAVGLPGSACAIDDDCSRFAPCDETTGVCASTPTLGLPCTIGCAGDAWCDGTCRSLLENGRPCGADNQCASGYCSEGPAFDFCAERAICW